MNRQNVTKCCLEFIQRKDRCSQRTNERKAIIELLQLSTGKWRRNSRKWTHDDKRVTSHHSRSV